MQIDNIFIEHRNTEIQYLKTIIPWLNQLEVETRPAWAGFKTAKGLPASQLGWPDKC